MRGVPTIEAVVGGLVVSMAFGALVICLAHATPGGPLGLRDYAMLGLLMCVSMFSIALGLILHEKDRAIREQEEKLLREQGYYEKVCRQKAQLEEEYNKLKNQYAPKESEKESPTAQNSLDIYEKRRLLKQAAILDNLPVLRNKSSKETLDYERQITTIAEMYGVDVDCYTSWRDAVREAIRQSDKLHRDLKSRNT